MFKTSYTVARVFGIPIKLDLSLLVLMGLIWFNALRAGLGLFNSFVWGGVMAMLLLLSIVLHELGHSLAAMRYGCKVREITLMLLGGRASLSHMPAKPSQEFVVAIAGPLVSLALWQGGGYGHARFSGHEALVPSRVADMCLWLGWMNGGLFWFNLVPAFPMDGGRVLRAVLAQRLGRLRATNIAANIGRGLAVATLVWLLMPGPAVLHVNAFSVEILGHVYTVGPIHESFDGFMLALIALFIFQAASQEYALVRAEEYFRQSGQRPPWMPPPPPRNDVYVSPPPYDRKR